MLKLGSRPADVCPASSVKLLTSFSMPEESRRMKKINFNKPGRLKDIIEIQRNVKSSEIEIVNSVSVFRKPNLAIF